MKVRNDRRKGKREEDAPARFRLTLWHVVSLLLGMALMWGVLFLCSSWERHRIKSRNASKSAHGRDTAGASTKPWGALEYTELSLSLPDDLLDAALEPAPVAPWWFKGESAQEVLNLLAGADLTEPQRSALLNTNNWLQSGGVIRVTPPLDVVEGLSPGARQKIYGVMGRHRENLAQLVPFRTTAEKLQSLLEESGLSSESRALVRRLAYAEGDTVCFADGVLFQARQKPEEARRLARVLCRASTFLMKLRVGPASDVDGLVRYWGAAGREQAIRPLVRSLARVRQGTDINVLYLLPPFARTRLYQYATSDAGGMPHEDCFWSAMNFFNEKPDHQFSSWTNTQQVLLTKYRGVRREDWAFGDVVLLLDGAEAMHMCVYIADDVVFTKNGVSLRQPWMLMRIDAMLRLYPASRSIQLYGYRRISP